VKSFYVKLSKLVLVDGWGDQYQGHKMHDACIR